MLVSGQIFRDKNIVKNIVKNISKELNNESYARIK